MSCSIITVCKNNLTGLKTTAKSIENIKVFNKEIKIKWHIQDGLSNDGTIEFINSDLILNSLCDSFCSVNDNGIYDAMNKAITKIDNSDLVIYLNAGDILSSNFIKRFETAHITAYDFVYSDTIMNGALNKSPQHIDFAYLLGKTINHQSYFIKAGLLKKYPFKTEYSIVADWVQLMEIFKNETLQIKKLEYPIAVYEGGGISEKQDDLRIQQREQYLRSIYSDWELESLMKIARLRQRPWYDFMVKSLDSPKRSRALTSLAKILK